MSNLAKDAKLHHYGSHSVKASYKTDEGISNEEVFLYFDAIWRGKQVTVTMRADRYSASYYNPATDERTDKLTPWRTYATEARYGSQDAWANRGESVTGNARSALSEHCEPLVLEWLNSEAYTESYQRAVARMIMRYFNDRHFVHKYVSEALVKFDAVLPVEISQEISAARDAYEIYMQRYQQASEIINDREG